ncbi:MAG: hypothetical protein ABEJ02_02140, partial [Candidatus Paceibacteria bacterium]
QTYVLDEYIVDTLLQVVFCNLPSDITNKNARFNDFMFLSTGFICSIISSLVLGCFVFLVIFFITSLY